jgi:cell division transport system permease protein
MKKKSLGKTGSWTVVFTIALALFNIGLFGLIILSGNQLSKMIKQNFEIQVFMNQDFDRIQLRAFQQNLAAKGFVANNKAGEPEIVFVSKELAGQRFMVETGEDFSQFLGENPLRDAFSIKIKDSYLELNKLKQIKAEIEQMEGVFEVIYVESLIGSIQENLKRVFAIFAGISFLVLVTVVWLIRNTIRLSVYSQRFLIRSMSLVGADPWFIQKPFIWSMCKQGFSGGLLSAIALLLGIHFAGEYYPPIRQVIVPEQVGILILTLVFAGIILSSLSTWLSVRNFLNKGLDQLHIY